MKGGYLIGDDSHLLTIPYSVSRAPNPNHGYIDLKAEPNRIDEIYELEGFPELRAFLLTFNDPDSLMRTLRVDTSFDTQRRQGFRHSCSSYITIGFDSASAEHDPKFFRELFDCFVNRASEYVLPYASDLKFLQILVTVPASGFRGWCLDIVITAWGASRAKAKSDWAKCFAAVSEYLIYVERDNRVHQIIEEKRRNGQIIFNR